MDVPQNRLYSPKNCILGKITNIHWYWRHLLFLRKSQGWVTPWKKHWGPRVTWWMRWNQSCWSIMIARGAWKRPGHPGSPGTARLHSGASQDLSGFIMTIAIPILPIPSNTIHLLIQTYSECVSLINSNYWCPSFPFLRSLRPSGVPSASFQQVSMVRLDDVLHLERLDAGELKSDSWCLQLMSKLLLWRKKHMNSSSSSCKVYSFWLKLDEITQ